ncbi:clarin-3-like [Neocloeon triangulifer]|uniref:clarin-3-like n=1 Tax=Neocloeon triangulifer TaxID=2078957 RepID=UPI00286F5733|nr:clarin-3-like [Neocloeon triangulifer]
MAITHRTFVLLTFPISCISIALLATALASPNWIQARALYEEPTYDLSDINYGLFTGTLTRRILLTPKSFSLHMTCLVDLNICALSCLGTEEERQEEVRLLYDTQGDVNATECAPVVLSQGPEYITDGQLRKDQFEIKPLPQNDKLVRFDRDPVFINMGLWASTIAFIALALLMATVGAIFSVLNTAGNPVEPILGIMGLFIWNAIAAVAIDITLILWGIQYGITLVTNVALTETIIGLTSTNGLAALGFSFWILIGADVAHVVNIGLLLYRRHLIRTEPPAPTVELKDDSDGAIFLY